jgi:hypothetical protein
MAISVTNPTPAGFGWIFNATSADASGCETLKAAVDGKSILVDHLTISTGAAITVTIGAGASAGAVETALIGPLAMAANSSMQWDFSAWPCFGMRLAADKALTIDTSGAGAICVFARGRVL